MPAKLEPHTSTVSLAKVGCDVHMSVGERARALPAVRMARVYAAARMVVVLSVILRVKEERGGRVTGGGGLSK